MHGLVSKLHTFTDNLLSGLTLSAAPCLLCKSDEGAFVDCAWSKSLNMTLYRSICTEGISTSSNDFDPGSWGFDVPDTVTEGTAADLVGIGGFGLSANRDSGDFTLPVDPDARALGLVSGARYPVCLLRDGLMSDLKVYVGDGFAAASSSCASDREYKESLSCWPSSREELTAFASW